MSPSAETAAAVPSTGIFEAVEPARAWTMVAGAIEQLCARSPAAVPLAELAAAAGLSEGQFQRVFSAWAGISPKRFQQFLGKEYAKQALRAGQDVLNAALAAGLSGPGRLHDLLVSAEAVSPGEWRAGGSGLTLVRGLADTPFGRACLTLAPRGLHRLTFADTADAELARLRADWPHARLVEDHAAAQAMADAVFAQPPAPGRALHLWVRGTQFQLRVWEALLAVPPGRLVAYADLARALGRPGAARAVGGAVGANPVAVLIPCHRVIRAAGELGGYHWGLTRKRALIGYEAARGAVEAVPPSIGAEAADLFPAGVRD